MDVDVVARARELKNRAMDERDLGEWKGALELLGEATTSLTDALKDIRENKDSDLREFETSVQKQLYHLLGSRGGVYRRRAASPEREPGDMEAALESYEDGWKVEKEFTDSYNLTQRLVTRVLMQPSAALDEWAMVSGINLREALRKAKVTLREQTADPNGPRNNDEYAFADAMILAVLLGEPSWTDAVYDFTRRASKSSYARTVTLEVLGELVAGVGRDGSAAPLLERLKEALRLASI